LLTLTASQFYQETTEAEVIFCSQTGSSNLS